MRACISWPVSASSRARSSLCAACTGRLRPARASGSLPMHCCPWSCRSCPAQLEDIRGGLLSCPLPEASMARRPRLARCVGRIPAGLCLDLPRRHTLHGDLRRHSGGPHIASDRHHNAVFRRLCIRPPCRTERIHVGNGNGRDRCRSYQRSQEPALQPVTSTAIIRQDKSPIGECGLAGRNNWWMRVWRCPLQM